MLEFALSSKVSKMKRERKIGQIDERTEKERREDRKRRMRGRREGMYSRTPVRQAKRQAPTASSYTGPHVTALRQPHPLAGAKGALYVPLTFHGLAQRIGIVAFLQGNVRMYRMISHEIFY